MPLALHKPPLFLQSLQSDKEALQEGRGAVVKYRRTADGYIQIGTAGCGVVKCLLALITQPLVFTCMSVKNLRAVCLAKSKFCFPGARLEQDLIVIVSSPPLPLLSDQVVLLR